MTYKEICKQCGIDYFAFSQFKHRNIEHLEEIETIDMSLEQS